MHHPSTEKRPSVFYDYEIFPFVRPPEMNGESQRRKVVIVGAGPVGMTLALLLAKSGVPSVIIESEAQVSQGSRAVAFTRRSMEILQQAGADKPFVENGYGWNAGQSFFRGKEVFQMEIPVDPDDRFPPILNNSQQYWEEYLSNFVEAEDLTELRWQTKYLSHDDIHGGVMIALDTPEGEYRLEADWLIACDGGRSQVRRHMGLRMDGVGYDGKFVITDFKAPEYDFPTERKCYFDPPWNPGSAVLFHRQPNDIWRFDYRLPDGETEEAALDPDVIHERTHQIMKLVGEVVDWELDWATVYSPNTKTLPDYVQGHVLFAGDAAHLLPIFGIRGANTGLQDAENLAWKLALVIKGQSDHSILDSYSDERVASAREICDEAGKSTRMMDPPSEGYKIMRDVILTFSLSDDFCSEMLHWRTSRSHEYLDSRLNAPDDDNAQFDGGIPDGVVAQNIHLGPDEFLFDHFRFQHTLLVFSSFEGEAPDAGQLEHRDKVRVISIGGGITGADVDLAEASERFIRKYDVHAGGMYLLRPDMHVCGRWKGTDLSGANTTLAMHLGEGDRK